jgi:hypothetical protein
VGPQLPAAQGRSQWTGAANHRHPRISEPAATNHGAATNYGSTTITDGTAPNHSTAPNNGAAGSNATCTVYAAGTDYRTRFRSGHDDETSHKAEHHDQPLHDLSFHVTDFNAGIAATGTNHPRGDANEGLSRICNATRRG